MAKVNNESILFDELIKTGADENSAKLFVEYLTTKERDDSLLDQIKYCGPFDKFFDKSSPISKAARAIIKRQSGPDLKNRFILACIALHGNDYRHLYSAIVASPFDNNQIMDAFLSRYPDPEDAFVHTTSIGLQDSYLRSIRFRYKLKSDIDSELYFKAARLSITGNQMTTLDLSNRALILMLDDNSKDYSDLANEFITLLEPIIDNQISKIGSNDVFDKDKTGDRIKFLLPTILKLAHYSEKYKKLFVNLLDTLPLDKVVCYVSKEDNYYSELVPMISRERLLDFADVCFDFRLYSVVIDALSGIPDDEIIEQAASCIIASYNNISEYDKALTELSKHKNLYSEKMRKWYFYEAFAFYGKHNFKEALENIDAGIEACNKEKGQSGFDDEDYEEEIADYERLRSRCQAQ